MNMILSMLREAAASKTSKVPRTFRSKKSYEFFSPRLSWIPCQAAMCTMQSQARNISVSFDRSRIDPSIKSAPFFKSRGARTSRITGVSPWSSNMGTRVWPRFPDPPVKSTFIVFSPTYRFSPGNTHAGRTALPCCLHRIENPAHPLKFRQHMAFVGPGRVPRIRGRLYPSVRDAFLLRPADALSINALPSYAGGRNPLYTAQYDRQFGLSSPEQKAPADRSGRGRAELPTR